MAPAAVTVPDQAGPPGAIDDALEALAQDMADESAACLATIVDAPEPVQPGLRLIFGLYHYLGQWVCHMHVCVDASHDALPPAIDGDFEGVPIYRMSTRVPPAIATQVLADAAAVRLRVTSISPAQAETGVMLMSTLPDGRDSMLCLSSGPLGIDGVDTVRVDFELPAVTLRCDIDMPLTFSCPSGDV